MSYQMWAKARMWLASVFLLAAVGCRQGEARLPPDLEAARQTLQAGDLEEARELLLAVAEQKPESLTALVNLALLQRTAGELHAAIATLNRAIDLNPADPRIWQIYAHLLLDTGNPHGVYEILEKAPTPTPATHTITALADIQLGDPERARHHIERALNLDPAYGPALFNLAVLYRDFLNNPVEAQAAFRSFSRAHPRQERARLSDTEFLSTSAPITDAASERATVQIPPPPETQRDAPPRQPTAAPTAADLIQRANTQAEQGDLDAALLTLKQAVQTFPNHPDAVWNLAEFYDKIIQDQTRATGLYRTFASLFPNDPRLASIPESARSPLPQPTTSQSRRAMFFQQALDHYNRREWDQAIAAYRRVLAIDPTDASAAFNLGLAYKASGDLEAAATAFRLALDQDSEMVNALYMLGLTERDRGRTADALMLLNRLIRLRPDYAKAHHLLGIIYLNEGRPDMTAIHFERFVQLDATSPEAGQVNRWLAQQRPDNG